VPSRRHRCVRPRRRLAARSPPRSGQVSSRQL